jgi:hypothetical protein
LMGLLVTDTLLPLPGYGVPLPSDEVNVGSVVPWFEWRPTPSVTKWTVWWLPIEPGREDFWPLRASFFLKG